MSNLLLIQAPEWFQKQTCPADPLAMFPRACCSTITYFGSQYVGLGPPRYPDPRRNACCRIIIWLENGGPVLCVQALQWAQTALCDAHRTGGEVEKVSWYWRTAFFWGVPPEEGRGYEPPPPPAHGTHKGHR